MLVTSAPHGGASGVSDSEITGSEATSAFWGRGFCRETTEEWKDSYGLLYVAALSLKILPSAVLFPPRVRLDSVASSVWKSACDVARFTVGSKGVLGPAPWLKRLEAMSGEMEAFDVKSLVIYDQDDEDHEDLTCGAAVSSYTFGMWLQALVRWYRKMAGIAGCSSPISHNQRISQNTVNHPVLTHSFLSEDTSSTWKCNGLGSRPLANRFCWMGSSWTYKTYEKYIMPV